MGYELLKNYMKQIETDLTFDTGSLEPYVQRVPLRKHFWIARLIEAKLKLKELKETKSQKEAEIIEKTERSMGASKATIIKIIKDTPVIKDLTSKIDELEILIEYLEKVEKVFSQTTYDLKNVIDLKRNEIS